MPLGCIMLNCCSATPVWILVRIPYEAKAPLVGAEIPREIGPLGMGGKPELAPATDVGPTTASIPAQRRTAPAIDTCFFTARPPRVVLSSCSLAVFSAGRVLVS